MWATTPSTSSTRSSVGTAGVGLCASSNRLQPSPAPPAPPHVNTSLLARHVTTGSSTCTTLSGGRRGSGWGRIRVGVRIRPAFGHEMKSAGERRGGYRPAVFLAGEISDARRMEDQRWAGCSENTDDTTIGRDGEWKNHRVHLRRMDGQERGFVFDHAFNPRCGQQEVYESIAAPVVDGAIEGLNGLIMAYGQTASGKSYTMGALQESGTAEAVDFTESNPSFTHQPSAPTAVFGRDPHAEAGRSWDADQEARDSNSSATYVGPGKARSSSAHYARCAPEAGIIPRALCRVFEHITSVERASSVSVTVSLLQIYNEVVQDLLGPVSDVRDETAPGLMIREDPALGFFVEGLREYRVASHRQAITLVNHGLRQRTTARTANNDMSSRSHTLVTISLLEKCGARSHSANGHSKRSKLVLVDLAGSERAGRPGGRGIEGNSESLREAGYINGSLSALGNVIAALGQAQLHRPHIPFRDSKLTRILADSLGGNSNAALIATVGPAPQNHAESLSTLVFASRCMRVRTSPTNSRGSSSIRSNCSEHVDQSEVILRLRAQVSSMQREFCRREAIQQGRYETVITRLARELDYARHKSSPMENRSHESGSEQSNQVLATSPRMGPRTTTSKEDFWLGVAPCSAVDAPSISGVAGDSPSTDGQTDGTGSVGEDGDIAAATRSTTQAPQGNINDVFVDDDCLEDEGMSDECVTPQNQGDRGRNIALMRQPAASDHHSGIEKADLDAAWDIIRAAVLALGEVGEDGADFLREARQAGLPREVADSTAKRVGTSREYNNANIANVDHTRDAVQSKDVKLTSRRIAEKRNLCKSVLDEAKTMLSGLRKENSSLKHVLQAEIALRREREVEVQRLRGALRHLLADGEDLHNTTKAAPAIGNSGGLSQASTEGAPEDTLRHRQISCSQSDHQWGQHLEQVENATLATNEDLVEGESGR